MPKSEIAQKLIIVESIGSIGELGGISGPILNPCYVPLDTINLMLNHQRKVYEVNPKNYSEKVRLSLKNLRKQNFAEETVNVKAHVAPNIYTAATVRNSNDTNRKSFEDSDMVTPTVKTTVKKTTAKTESKVEATEEKKGNPTSDFTKNN